MSTTKNTKPKNDSTTNKEIQIGFYPHKEKEFFPDQIGFYLDKASNFYEMLSVIANSEIVFVEALSRASYLDVAELQDWLNAISQLLKKSNELKHFESSTFIALDLNDK